jgi:glc operon protein GlcG
MTSILKALRPLATIAVATFSLQASAQTPAPAAPVPPPAYGAPISIEQAKKAMAAAEAEASKNGWQVVISIVDTGGYLVMLQRLGAQNASVDIATGKAVTAVNFRRPSKALEDGLAANGSALRLLAVPGVTPIQGGLPIVMDGKIIGGIGVSGVTSAQDEQIAKAGSDTLTVK